MNDYVLVCSVIKEERNLSLIATRSLSTLNRWIEVGVRSVGRGEVAKKIFQ